MGPLIIPKWAYFKGSLGDVGCSVRGVEGKLMTLTPKPIPRVTSEKPSDCFKASTLPPLNQVRIIIYLYTQQPVKLS